MRKTATYALILFCFNVLGQNKRILSFNLIDGVVDTLNIADFDSSIISERTDYFVGGINEEINYLNEEKPTENIYPESNFTRKRQASVDYNIEAFPIELLLNYC